MKNTVYILLSILAMTFASASLKADTTTIGGVEYVCEDGVCKPRDGALPFIDEVPLEAPDKNVEDIRYLEGYVNADRFIDFLDAKTPSHFFGHLTADTSIIILLFLAFLAGLAMNLTPCVLPMIPINLIIIGKSAKRGFVYALGMTLAYGTMGIASSFGALAFGAIQSNPWFNLIVGIIFLLLASSLFGLFNIDFSKIRKTRARGDKEFAIFYVFLIGALASILSGACVAPVLIAVLVLTADIFSKGTFAAILLPFAMGAGMAAPWPLAGAGMKVLPRPGAWMVWVNRIFASLMAVIAFWYISLGVKSFSSSSKTLKTDANEIAMTPDTFSLENLKRPILVDCWATWCKNCTAMDGVLSQKRVKERLSDYTVIKLQAEDLGALRSIPIFKNVRGLPAFAIIGEHHEIKKEENSK